MGSDGIVGRAAGGQPRRVIDAGRLWFGGVMAALVAAGVAIVGLLIARGILDVPVLVERSGKVVNANTWWYAAAAFLAGILATGLLHALLVSAPQPYRFFRWITGLAVTIAVLVPFTSGAGVDTKLAVALINLVVGVCIVSIVSSVGRSAARVFDEPYEY
jgi:hypothetical protein